MYWGGTLDNVIFIERFKIDSTLNSKKFCGKISMFVDRLSVSFTRRGNMHCYLAAVYIHVEIK